MTAPSFGKPQWRSDDCYCAYCWQPGEGGPLSWPMFLCPECGNKRCPKATHHDNKCTGSNESGQAGSRY